MYGFPLENSSLIYKIFKLISQILQLCVAVSIECIDADIGSLCLASRTAETHQYHHQLEGVPCVPNAIPLTLVIPIFVETPIATRRIWWPRDGNVIYAKESTEETGSAINLQYSTLTTCHLVDTRYASLDVAMHSGRYQHNVSKQKPPGT